ncbi:MAG TPA: 50S ribosomal protein L17 [Candidatus Mcinerneyibacteriales bacterium]|nr:50S ribosomal protein L17 [Candidatus Mcinerneyibacteriales bacterium]HPQ89046.1 50S ribosomal protein L17 [Candidatus Mcinerneyibacteriales bacterium]
MRHRVKSVRLGRNWSSRKALLRNMATSLILHERIETTEVKAKQIKSYVEKLVTLGKKDTLHARRMAAARLFGKEAVQKLFSDIAPRFTERNGGYLTLYKTGFRKGDATPTAIVEFVVRPEEKSSKEKEKKK